MSDAHRGPYVGVDDATRAVAQGDGRAVRIAVLDSGLDAAHPALHAMQLGDRVAIDGDGRHMRCADDASGDLYGHGTAVAGMIHRVAPRAVIGSFRVLGADGRSRSAFVREAAFEALDRGYHILHCSLGCPGENRFLPLYKEWIDEAYLRGAHVVAAAGNVDPDVADWPSHFSTVISVAMGQVAPDALAFAPSSLVEFRALGHGVDVAWRGGGAKKVTGSSFAAPVATAILARLLGEHPGTPPLEAKALLQRISVHTASGSSAAASPSFPASSASSLRPDTSRSAPHPGSTSAIGSIARIP